MRRRRGRDAFRAETGARLRYVGTLAFMAPERIVGGDYSYASDIWSAGLCLATCALGRIPLPQADGYRGRAELFRLGEIRFRPSPPPRNIRVVAAAPPRPAFAGIPPRNIRVVVAAAPPRPAFAGIPPRNIRVVAAATRPPRKFLSTNSHVAGTGPSSAPSATASRRSWIRRNTTRLSRTSRTRACDETRTGGPRRTSCWTMRL